LAINIILIDLGPLAVPPYRPSGRTMIVEGRTFHDVSYFMDRPIGSPIIQAVPITIAAVENITIVMMLIGIGCWMSAPMLARMENRIEALTTKITVGCLRILPDFAEQRQESASRRTSCLVIKVKHDLIILIGTLQVTPMIMPTLLP